MKSQPTTFKSRALPRFFRATCIAGLLPAFLLLLSIHPGQAQAQGGTWTTQSSELEARIESAAATSNGLFYVFGGSNGSGASTRPEVYDPIAGSWAFKAPDRIVRSQMVAQTINDKIYVAEGWINADSTTPTKVLAIYDPATNRWSKGRPSRVARGESASAVVNGKLYITGGVINGGSRVFRTLEIYDPVANSWSTGGPEPIATDGSAGASINGKFYVVGGTKKPSNVLTGALQIYDPATNTWTTGASMPTPRVFLVAGVIDGKLYAVGGSNGTSLSTLEIYNPVSNTWTTGTPEPTARSIAVGAVIGSMLYTTGGYNASSTIDGTLDVYTPDSACMSPPVVVTTTVDEDDGTPDPNVGTGTSLREAINFTNTVAGCSNITFDPTVFGVAGAPHVIDLLSALPSLGTDLTINGPGANIVTVQRDANASSFSIFYVSSGHMTTIEGLTISNGSAGFPGGGGIYNDHATLTVSNCAISGNVANNDGGGIYSDGRYGNASLIIIDSTISGNSSSLGGGGVFSDSDGGTATLIVANCTLNGNSSTYGGGIWNDGDSGGTVTLIVVNSTLSDNSANQGGGIFNDGSNGGSASLNIGNTILKAGASGENIFDNGGSTITSRGYNLSSDAAGGFLTGTGDQINTDPLLDPAGLQDNGGPTQTIALQSGSPAVDQGKRNTVVTFGTDIDQRGFVRPHDFPLITNAAGGDGSDIGAFELQ